MAEYNGVPFDSQLPIVDAQPKAGNPSEQVKILCILPHRRRRRFVMLHMFSSFFYEIL